MNRAFLNPDCCQFICTITGASSEQVLYAKPMLSEFGETGYLKRSGVGSSACEEKGGAHAAQQRACKRAGYSHKPQERLYFR